MACWVGRRHKNLKNININLYEIFSLYIVPYVLPCCFQRYRPIPFGKIERGRLEQDHRVEITGTGISFQKLQGWQAQDFVPVQEQLRGQGHCAVPDENDPRPQWKNLGEQPTFRLALAAGRYVCSRGSF